MSLSKPYGKPADFLAYGQGGSSMSAMYEKEGFCPNNSFLHFKIERGETRETEIIDEILGSRLGYMVYGPGECDSRFWYSSIVTLLYGEPDSAAIKLAEHLVKLIPECEYAKCGRKIRLHDINAIPTDIHFDYGTRELRFENESTISGSKTIIQSPNWLVIVDNHNGGDDPIDVYICRIFF